LPTEDVRGGKAPLPRRVERKLLVRPLPTEMFAETLLLPGGGTDIGLGDHIEENYLSDWRVVSHTLAFTEDGGAVLTVLVERPR
jgi:hypothetical protein